MKVPRVKQKVLLLPVLFIILAFSGCSLFGSNVGKTDPNATSTPAPTPVPETFADGVTYGDIDISGMTLKEAVSAGEKAVKNLFADLTVTLELDTDSMNIEGSSLAYTDNTEKTLAQAIKNKSSTKISYAYVVDEEQVKTLIEPAAEAYNKAPINATVDGFDGENFSFISEQQGRELDVDKTTQAVMAQIKKMKSGTVSAADTKIDASIKEADLAEKFTLISSYTSVSTNNENGNHNMALALSRINGTVIEPGGTFSYEEIVGDSTSEETGFLPAGGLSGGVLVPMYGGGICQASSTIYGAVVRAGMDITVRECHSSPSSYVPIGMDATVSYGDYDLQFVNILDYPIYIVSWMEDVTLYVHIYGCYPDEWNYIEVNSWESGTIDPPEGEQYIVDESLATNEVVLKTSGNYGYYAEAQRTYYKDGEEVKTEDLPSSYYEPTMRTYAVGPGTDTSQLVNGEFKQGETS